MNRNTTHNNEIEYVRTEQETEIRRQNNQLHKSALQFDNLPPQMKHGLIRHLTSYRLSSEQNRHAIDNRFEDLIKQHPEDQFFVDMIKNVTENAEHRVSNGQTNEQAIHGAVTARLMGERLLAEKRTATHSPSA